MKNISILLTITFMFIGCASKPGTDFTTSSKGGGCMYTKIGDWVYCNINWFVTTPSGTASSGGLQIHGMPFVCNSGGNSVIGSMCTFGRVTLPAAGTYGMTYATMNDNESIVYLYYLASASGANAFEADNLEGNTTPFGGFSIGYPCD